MRNSSAWLAEVVRMPKSSVYIQLSNGGFFAVAGFFKVLGSLYDSRICWLLFVCIYCVRLVWSTFCAFCKRWLQRWMSAVFCVQLLKGETFFKCPYVVLNLLGHSYFRDVGCTQSKDLTSFKVFVFRLSQNRENQRSGSSCLIVYPPFCPRGITELPVDVLSEDFVFEYFWKTRKKSSLIKIW